MPALVPFAFSNESTLQLAKHLLRHRTASPGTLYQYLYGVYRFCKWLNTQPKQLIRDCADIDGDTNLKAIAKYNLTPRRLRRRTPSRRPRSDEGHQGTFEASTQLPAKN